MRPTNPYYENYSMQRITEALLKLMESYPFDEITIMQITQEAEIARRTFYLYYDTKMDVLKKYYDVLIREYEQNYTDPKNKSLREHTQYFFEFWYLHQDYPRLLLKQDMFAILISSFSSYLLNTNDVLDEKDAYIVSFLSGGLWAAMYTWAQNDFARTPKEMTETVMRFQQLS